MDTRDPDTAYAIEYSQIDGGILVARVTGPRDSTAISIAYWRDIAAVCAERGIRHIIVIEELEERVSLAETAELIDAMLQMGFGDIRIAFIDSREDQAMLADAEYVAARAGLHGRVFTDFDEAKAWLLERIERRQH